MQPPAPISGRTIARRSGASRHRRPRAHGGRAPRCPKNWCQDQAWRSSIGIGVPRSPRMIHLRPMTKHEMPSRPKAGSNAPQPVRSLRDWLDHLAAHDRLAVLKPNVGLKFEIAAYAKRLDGQRATVFPRPDGHPIPVVSGLVSDRGWMAEAMGVEPSEMLTRFQDAAENPLPWQEV